MYKNTLACLAGIALFLTTTAHAFPERSDSLEEMTDMTRAEVRELESELRELREVRDELREEIQEMRGQLRELRADHEDMERAVERMRHSAEEMRGHAERLERERREIAEARKVLQHSVHEMREGLEHAEHERNELRAVHERIEHESREHREQIERARRERPQTDKRPETDRRQERDGPVRDGRPSGGRRVESDRRVDVQPQRRAIRRPIERKDDRDDHNEMMENLAFLNHLARQLDKPQDSAMLALSMVRENLEGEQRIAVLQRILERVKKPRAIRNAARLMLIETYQNMGHEGAVAELIIQMIVENAD